MRLEFSTCAYLCAEWFISGNDHDGVGGLIHKIVRQEMFHFGLAGNILSAINGTFKLTDKNSCRPIQVKNCQGRVKQNLTVDLLPLSKDQLKVLMQIEKPEFDPVELAAFGDAAPPATIGEFYTELTAAIERQNPTFDQTAAFKTSDRRFSRSRLSTLRSAPSTRSSRRERELPVCPISPTCQFSPAPPNHWRTFMS